MVKSYKHTVPFSKRLCLTVRYDIQQIGHVERASTSWE